MKDALAKINESHDKIVARIFETWRRATPADIEAGATWYADGEAIIDGLASRSDYTREQIAAAVAHLSPRTRWQRNIAAATALVLTGDTAGTGAMTPNVERARIALASSKPGSTFGPSAKKTRRFMANLLGDREAVTVDVWAVVVALGVRPDWELVIKRAGIYEALERAYQAAAHDAGVNPATMQATTWIVARNGRAA